MPTYITYNYQRRQSNASDEKEVYLRLEPKESTIDERELLAATINPGHALACRTA